MLKQKIAKLMDLQHFTSTSTNYENACKLKQDTFDLYQEVCADVDGTAKRIAELEAEVERLKQLISDDCIKPQQFGAVDDAVKGGAQ